MIPEDDLLQVGFKLISVIQERPFHVPLRTKFVRVITVFLTLFLTVLTVINFTKVEGKKFCRTGESLILEFQLLTKYVTLIYFQPDLIKLYKCTERYWKIDEAESEVAMKLKGYYKFMRTFLRALVFSSLTAVIGLYVKPLIMYNESEIMVMECWVPDVYFLTSRSLLFVQYWVLCGSEAIIIGFDCIFGALVFHLYAQIVYLNSEMRSLYMDRMGDAESDRKAQEKLKKCIRYHRFLSEVFMLMNSVFSYLFLCQYFSTVVNTCMEFYLLTDSITNFDGIEIIKSIFYLFSLLFEFGFFCFPAEYIKDEVMNIADSIYESRWNESKLKFQRQLLIVMMKAQRPPQFKAGGFSVIDLNTFISIFKAAFSFFTIMRRVFDK